MPARAFAFLAVLWIAGCATSATPTWTITPDTAAPVPTTGLEYVVELAKSFTRWRGELSAHAPLRRTILYLWLDAPGLRAIVGQGESAIRCSPGEHGVAGEGDGYAWTVEPRPDGCKITLELVTKHNAPEDLAWSIDGWQSGEGAIQASLDVTPHPGR